MFFIFNHNEMLHNWLEVQSSQGGGGRHAPTIPKAYIKDILEGPTIIIKLHQQQYCVSLNIPSSLYMHHLLITMKVIFLELNTKQVIMAIPYKVYTMMTCPVLSVRAKPRDPPSWCLPGISVTRDGHWSTGAT